MVSKTILVLFTVIMTNKLYHLHIYLFLFMLSLQANNTFQGSKLEC